MTKSSFHTQVVTYTSDLRGAGTDATVFVELHGQQGSGPRLALLPQGQGQGAAADSFTRGGVDSFQLPMPDLGDLHSLTVGEAFVSFIGSGGNV